MAALATYLVGPEGEFGYTGTVDVSAPSGLVATPGVGQVALRWLAPNPSGDVTDYVVQFKPASSGVWSTFSDGVGTSPIAVVTGLTNGTPYDFRVAAVRSGVTGNFSAVVRSTPSSLVVKTLFGYNTNQSDSPLSERLAWWNNRAPCVRRYYKGPLPAQFEQTTAIAPEKRLSISFKPGGVFDAAAMASGAFNDMLRRWLESIPAGWTVYLSYLHEVNDDIKKGRLTGAQFVNAYKQFMPVIQDAALRTGVVVKLCANFMAYQLTATTTATWSDAWVPPPGAMDLCTFDIYGNPGVNTQQVTGPGYGTDYPDPAIRAASMFGVLRRTGWLQHWGILELNTPARDWDTNESQRAAWLKAMTDHLLGQPTPPEILLFWEAPSGINWDQSFGRVSGNPLTCANAVAPYLYSVPDGSP